MSKRKIIGYIFLVAIIAFCWWNSAQIGEVSGRFSLWFAEKALAVFGETSAVGILVQKFIRKIGHFVEYGALGFCSVFIFIFTDKLRLQTAVNLLFLGLATAVIDETIQMFSPGRVSAVKDVWIDMSGFVALGFAALIITRICRAIGGAYKRQ